MEEKIWTTRDGRQVLVSQMDTRHIVNCIRLIRRTGWRKEYLARLRLELEIRRLEDRL